MSFLVVIVSLTFGIRAGQKSKARRRLATLANSDFDEGTTTFHSVENPIERYVSTPKRRSALSELKSSPRELADYIHQEIDTFFMNEWAKMSVVYLDKSGRFDEDVRDNAGYQMREILDAIFTKFAKKKRAALVEKQFINEALKSQHKEEIDIAMQVYEKWQDKS